MIYDLPHWAARHLLPDHFVDGYDDQPDDDSVEEYSDDNGNAIKVFNCAQKVEKCKKSRKSCASP